MTKFRRRALISSVAMLLVAMLALGTATFAWFTNNPEVAAEGLKMNTSADAGLLICSETEATARGAKNFTHSSVLNCVAGTGEAAGTYVTDATKAVAPVSVNLASGQSAFASYTATAGSEGNYAKTGNYDAQSTWSTGLHTEKIYLKTTGNSANNTTTVQLAKVTFTAPTSTYNLAKGVRVALFDSDFSVIGVWSARDADITYATGASTTGTYTTELASTATASMNKAVGNSGNDYVTLVVYLDGEDADCYTTNVQNLVDILTNVKVEFTSAASFT